MKRKAYLSLLLAALGLACVEAGEARTWTSAADASKTFEGEFVSESAGKVTVRKENGQQMTFPLDKLSEADQTWVAETKAAATRAEKLKSAAVPAGILGKLVRLDGKRLKKYDLEADKGIPEYYVVYYSASW